MMRSLQGTKWRLASLSTLTVLTLVLQTSHQAATSVPTTNSPTTSESKPTNTPQKSLPLISHDSDPVGVAQTVAQISTIAKQIQNIVLDLNSTRDLNGSTADVESPYDVSIPTDMLPVLRGLVEGLSRKKNSEEENGGLVKIEQLTGIGAGDQALMDKIDNSAEAKITAFVKFVPVKETIVEQSTQNPLKKIVSNVGVNKSENKPNKYVEIKLQDNITSEKLIASRPSTNAPPRRFEEIPLKSGPSAGTSFDPEAVKDRLTEVVDKWNEHTKKPDEEGPEQSKLAQILDQLKKSNNAPVVTTDVDEDDKFDTDILTLEFEDDSSDELPVKDRLSQVLEKWYMDDEKVEEPALSLIVNTDNGATVPEVFPHPDRLTEVLEELKQNESTKAERLSLIATSASTMKHENKHPELVSSDRKKETIQPLIEKVSATGNGIQESTSMDRLTLVSTSGKIDKIDEVHDRLTEIIQKWDKNHEEETDDEDDDVVIEEYDDNVPKNERLTQVLNDLHGDKDEQHHKNLDMVKVFKWNNAQNQKPMDHVITLDKLEDVSSEMHHSMVKIPSQPSHDTAPTPTSYSGGNSFVRIPQKSSSFSNNDMPQPHIIRKEDVPDSKIVYIESGHHIAAGVAATTAKSVIQQTIHSKPSDYVYQHTVKMPSVTFNTAKKPISGSNSGSNFAHGSGLLSASTNKESTDEKNQEIDDDDEIPQQQVVDEAAAYGIKMMEELVTVKEPELFKQGYWLEEGNPAKYLAMFSEPNSEVLPLARYGYASVQASMKLAESYSPLRRQFPGRRNVFKASALFDECPLRGKPRCPPASRRYRTSDGTCNNLEHPWRGASNLPMQRFLLPVYDDGVQSVRRSVSGGRLPSPRAISTRIHREKDKEMTTITLMFMQWGQFIDHDVISAAQSRAFNGSIPRCCSSRGDAILSEEFLHPECLPIPVPADDWFFRDFGVRCLEFIRSAPTSRVDCDLGWREQMNQATAYIDASTVYGSSISKSDSIRLFRDGKLQYGRSRNQGPLNPPDPPEGEICRSGALSTECLRAGDNRVGEQPALIAFHTMWLRYHNVLADELSLLNRHWSDEKVYQETRRIIGAMIQHITYREFLPIVLGQEVMDLFDISLVRKGYYTGYDKKINAAPGNSFGSAAFRFGHSLVQNSFVRSDSKHRPIFNNVSLSREQTNQRNVWSPGSLDRMMLGLSNQPCQRRDEFMADELTNHLFQSRNFPFGMDLAAINIQRARDHGIPGYTAWREPCGLSPIKDWIDLPNVMSFETAQRFRSLYAHVDDIDLFPAGLAEKPVRGGVVGPTFACIIAQQFSHFRKGDRFWYENGNFESSFTPAQLQQIRRITFAQVVCETMRDVETIQPFAFLAADNFRNARISCKSSMLQNFDLTAWTEKDSDVRFTRTRRDDSKAGKARRKTKPKVTTRPTTPRPSVTPFRNHDNATLYIKNKAVSTKRKPPPPKSNVTKNPNRDSTTDDPTDLPNSEYNKLLDGLPLFHKKPTTVAPQHIHIHISYTDPNNPLALAGNPPKPPLLNDDDLQASYINSGYHKPTHIKPTHSKPSHSKPVYSKPTKPLTLYEPLSSSSSTYGLGSSNSNYGSSSSSSSSSSSGAHSSSVYQSFLTGISSSSSNYNKPSSSHYDKPSSSYYDKPSSSYYDKPSSSNYGSNYGSSSSNYGSSSSYDTGSSYNRPSSGSNYGSSSSNYNNRPSSSSSGSNYYGSSSSNYGSDSYGSSSSSTNNNYGSSSSHNSYRPQYDEVLITTKRPIPFHRPTTSPIQVLDTSNYFNTPLVDYYTTTRRPYYTTTRRPYYTRPPSSYYDYHTTSTTRRPIIPTYLYLPTANYDTNQHSYTDREPTRPKPSYGNNADAYHNNPHYNLDVPLYGLDFPDDDDPIRQVYAQILNHPDSGLEPVITLNSIPKPSSGAFSTGGSGSSTGHTNYYTKVPLTDVHAVNDKLDFKTEATTMRTPSTLPDRYYDYNDNKKFVKISSIHGQKTGSGASTPIYVSLHNKQGELELDDLMPSSVQLDVTPSEAREDQWEIFEATDEIMSLLTVPDFNANRTCSSEVPKPMSIINENDI